MADISKRIRLEKTIAGEKPDRTPIALWRHWPGDDQAASSLAASHLQWQTDYDWDFLKVGPASSYSVADWGVNTRWVGHIEGTRETVSHPIHQPNDWIKLPVLDPTRGALGTQLDALRLIREQVCETVPFIATVFNPLSQAKHLASNPLLLSHMRRAPDQLRQGLETITETTIRFIEAAKKTGISGIYFAVQHARYPLLSREEYQIWGKGFDLLVLEAANDLWLNTLHIHSNDIMFDLLADYPVALVNWHDRETAVSLADGLVQIPGAASGGVDHWTLHEESPDNLVVEVADALAQTNGQRLVLGTGCVAMVTTPLRNIRRFREMV